MCIYVCMWMSVYVFVHVYFCVHVCACICVSVYLCVCVWTHTCWRYKIAWEFDKHYGRRRHFHYPTNYRKISLPYFHPPMHCNYTYLWGIKLVLRTLATKEFDKSSPIFKHSNLCSTGKHIEKSGIWIPSTISSIL